MKWDGRLTFGAAWLTSLELDKALEVFFNMEERS